MSFSFFKIKPTLSLVIDIRDASISIAVAKFELNKKPEIILCDNFDINKKNSKNYNKYLSSMVIVLDKAVVAIRKKLIKIGNKEIIGNSYFFIGSPWSISKIKTIKIIKDKFFRVDNSILGKLIFGEEFVIEKIIEEQNKGSDWEILEEKIIQSKLNGYITSDFFGKRTSNLEIELFVSFVPVEIKNKIASYAEGKVIKNIRLQSNSCVLSSFSFLRDEFPDKSNFVYVDLGKLVTDIYIVKDNVISGLASFPFGEENIIETSLHKTNLSREVFMSHINIGNDNNFNLVSHNNGSDLLKTGFHIFESNLKKSILQICTDNQIPQEMLIVTNSIISDMFIDDTIDKNNNSKFEILDKKVKILPITENIFSSSLLNGMSFSNEPYIKMDLIYLHKLLS